MSKSLSPSELILRGDGSIYHLSIIADNVADTVITVGDQDRAVRISKRFDKIECHIDQREFITITGTYEGKRLSVASTGIGTDNIDIFLNELDAAVNIDLENRKYKEELKSLNIIRIGTSGSVREDVPVGSQVISEYALGLDGLAYYYGYPFSASEKKLAKEIADHLQWDKNFAKPYIVPSSPKLMDIIGSDMIKGITATATGFYAPQGRALRLETKQSVEKLGTFDSGNHKLTNLEMETSGLYTLSNLLGHNCVSCSAILANRVTKEFAKDPLQVVDNLIDSVLERIVDGDMFS